MKRKISFHTTIFGLVLLLGTMSAVAQTDSYQMNLVSDVAGLAAHTDPKLINPSREFLPSPASLSGSLTTTVALNGRSVQPLLALNIEP